MALIIIFFGLLTISCGSHTSLHQRLRVISAADSVYEIASGDSLQIALGQCIGCADGWKVIFLDSVISAEDRGIRSDDNCEDCAGGSGNALFLVKGAHKGEGRIGLEMFGDTVIFRFRVK